jgi:hypothetical protein
LRMSRIPRTDDAGDHRARNLAHFLPAGKRSCPLLPSLCLLYTFHPKKLRLMLSPRFAQCVKMRYQSDDESDVHYSWYKMAKKSAEI